MTAYVDVAAVVVATERLCLALSQAAACGDEFGQAARAVGKK